MGLCLVGHHTVLPEGADSYSLGLKKPVRSRCPPSPGLAPWPVHITYPELPDKCQFNELSTQL